MGRQFAMGAMSMDLLENAAPSSGTIDNYVNEYIRYLTAHEVGHTLGLKHNFHGSTMLQPEDLNNTQITRTQGLVASVMDIFPLIWHLRELCRATIFQGLGDLTTIGRSSTVTR